MARSNRSILIFTFLFLSGCSLLQNYTPSKWDENQARVITDIRQEVGELDCSKDLIPQLDSIEKKIIWFNYYADFKDASDIKEMMDKLQTTTTELLVRANSGPVNPVYCQLKQGIMINQTVIIGSTIKESL